MKADCNETEPAIKNKILQADCLELYFFPFVTGISADKGNNTSTQPRQDYAHKLYKTQDR
jgi:hypothetical protein